MHTTYFFGENITVLGFKKIKTRMLKVSFVLLWTKKTIVWKPVEVPYTLHFEFHVEEHI